MERMNPQYVYINIIARTSSHLTLGLQQDTALSWNMGYVFLTFHPMLAFIISWLSEIFYSKVAILSVELSYFVAIKKDE